MHKTDTTHIEQTLRIVDLLQRKWTIHILWEMQAGPVRLSALKRRLPAASKKALRAGLRDLETAKVAVRHDLSDTVLHVEYHLNEDLKDTVSDLLAKLACAGESITKQGAP
jgi:DNA-binding HxlR family transcriptional regulator